MHSSRILQARRLTPWPSGMSAVARKRGAGASLPPALSYSKTCRNSISQPGPGQIGLAPLIDRTRPGMCGLPRSPTETPGDPSRAFRPFRPRPGLIGKIRTEGHSQAQVTFRRPRTREKAVKRALPPPHEAGQGIAEQWRQSGAKIGQQKRRHLKVTRQTGTGQADARNDGRRPTQPD